MGLLSDIRDIALISRPLNALMGGFAVVLAAFMAAGAGMAENLVAVTAGALSVVFFMAGANALNDYLDREVDKVNHPERPIPSGRMSPMKALAVGISGFVLSLAAVPFLPPLAIAVLLVALALMISYELWLKSTGLPGNTVVAVLTGMLFLYGGAIAGRPEGAYIFSALAFFSTLGREIIKDVEDMSGDVGRSTLPMRIGPKKASVAASAAILLAVAMSPLPYLTGEFSGRGMLAYLALVALCDAVFVYASATALIRDVSEDHSGVLPSKTTKAAMLLGLLAFLAGRVI